MAICGSWCKKKVCFWLELPSSIRSENALLNVEGNAAGLCTFKIPVGKHLKQQIFNQMLICVLGEKVEALGKITHS